jgi:hypothetical protein
MRSIKNLIIIILILIIIIITSLFWSKKTLRNPKVEVEIEKKEYLNHKGKCIDCEKEFSAETAWKGQSTKCFSCERDLLSRGDAKLGYVAKTMKYY